MKTLKQFTVKFLVLAIMASFTSCGNPDFEGIWTCKKGGDIKLIIKSISDNSYELKFDENDPSSLSGNVEDGVLVINMGGNIERFSIKSGELLWSGVFADECNLFIRE